MNKITPEKVAAFCDDPTLNMYQQVSSATAVYPGRGTFMGLMYVNAKLNGETGEFSEKVGKALRDDDILMVSQLDHQPIYCFNNLSSERREALILELGDVLWYVAAAARELGISLEDVASKNLVKILGRTTNQTLHGEGDNR